MPMKWSCIELVLIYHQHRAPMIVFNNNASVPEMAHCTSFSKFDSLDTPLKERGESVVRALLISPPIPPDERLQLREKILNGIQIRRIRWQVNQFYSCINTYLFARNDEKMHYPWLQRTLVQATYSNVWEAAQWSPRTRLHQSSLKILEKRQYHLGLMQEGSDIVGHDGTWILLKVSRRPEPETSRSV